MKNDNNQETFLALVQAGLWETEARLLLYEGVDYSEVFRSAEEQSVVGLVAAGLEHTDGVPYETKLKFIGYASQIQQRNMAMNRFIAELVAKLQSEGITPLLVKGQGVAQCYKRPLWRVSGDVDLLLGAEKYEKAIDYLTLLSSNCKPERKYSKEIGFYLGDILVELHGTLRTGLSSCIDKIVDEVQNDTFRNDKTRVWHNGETEVHLPTPDNDVFFVFTHFIKHLYKEKMSLRQMCDWSRLLWIYRNEIDSALLEKRIHKAGLLGEWKTFAALAVGYLGMPVEDMPLYDESDCWHKKGEVLLNFILKGRKPNKVRDSMFFLGQFPCNTLSFLPSIFFNVNRLKIKERLIEK